VTRKLTFFRQVVAKLKLEAKLRVKNQNSRIFDAKLRFKLLASLRVACFGQLKLTIDWLLFPQG
jgi:hypothetical protein